MPTTSPRTQNTTSAHKARVITAMGGLPTTVPAIAATVNANNPSTPPLKRAIIGPSLSTRGATQGG
jgi:hypothetical protein